MTDSPHYRSADSPAEVLLVEDNPGDVRLIKGAFAKIDAEVTFHTVSDGYEAIAFLKRRGTSESPDIPDLVLVELNLPGKDGCEVLEAIRDDPQLRCLPVIILTSSDDSTDVSRCYNAYVNAYLTKPSELPGFISLARSIEEFWLTKVQLPPVPN